MSPKTNGFDVCDALKHELPTACGVTLTAKGPEFDRQRGAAVGADRRLS